MSLAGAGLGGMSIAEAYMARKIHAEKMKRAAAEESSGGGFGNHKKSPENAYGVRKALGWCFGKPSLKKNSAKVSDLTAKE